VVGVGFIVGANGVGRTVGTNVETVGEGGLLVELKVGANVGRNVGCDGLGVGAPGVYVGAKVGEMFTITGGDDVAVSNPVAPVSAAIVLRLVLKVVDTAVLSALDRVAVETYSMIS
jgi:hypothetical protein